ncbi:hypothetical protein OG802_24715 [Streptomyces sp. NBC_00704]|uniref:hypothetical protein n=1 Tax=Streptomyces sp. NBC_00704 TaxID=2975809 RepID=UPI002E34D508|nr:hypothetical protein [Streptomyces sp. NBC_00704]
MPTHSVNEDHRLSFWPRVREFAVPAAMIETATARRRAGDWAGACAAAGFDVDFDLRLRARTHGRESAVRIRSDLRHLAPDLLRWHLPRIAPDGLLRPGLTVALARYDRAGRDGVRPVQLVLRTPPAWADAGQRVSLALLDASDPATNDRRHPHPRPDRRFRLDLHRHLWDARRAGELRVRSGADLPSVAPAADPPADPVQDPSGVRALRELGCAVDRWEAEARILLRAEGRDGGSVLVRIGAGRRLVLDVGEDGATTPARTAAGPGPGPGTETGRAGPVLRGAEGRDASLPVLPDAATWVLPDLTLLRSGAVGAGQLHPLVASALVPGTPEPRPAPPVAGPADGDRIPDPALGRARLVACQGATHRIGLVDGVLSALDHDPAEIRREELLAALTGTPLPCLRAIDRAHRRPDCLVGVRDRLLHGDVAGALAVVEGLLGPDAVLRDGPLRDELESAARRRIVHGLFRAGLTGSGPGPDRRPARPRPPRRHAH